MKKKFGFGSTLVLFLLLVVGLGIALAGANFDNTGNERKGKYLYRKNCRTCHDGSSAKDLSANSKTQAQWKRTFERHERLQCKDEWKKLSQDNLIDIFTYLYNHAYDSPQPATCG